MTRDLWKSRTEVSWGVKTGSSSQWQKSESIFEHKDIIQKQESYMWVNRHSISQGKWRCNRCEVRNKQGVSGNTIKVKYTWIVSMWWQVRGKQEMRLYYEICAGLGVDKYWVWAWDWVLGISEILQRWQKWLLESRMGWKPISYGLWELQDITVFPPSRILPRDLEENMRSQWDFLS